MKLRDIRRRAKTKFVTEEGVSFLRNCCTKRCDTYEAGCPICDEWRFKDTHGRFTRNFDELWNFRFGESK